MSSLSTLIPGILLLFFSVLPFALLAQSPAVAAAPPPLEKYIQEGLQSNLGLRQKHISLEKAEWALKAANSYFLPQVSFSGGYTHGDGGRAIVLPVGDLLNPVYSSLNKLTETNAFPQIENVEQTFFPQNFYDAHVRTALPLLNLDLQQNKRIQQDRVVLQEWEVKAYERELVSNIKQAYYHYLSAVEAVKIWESALELVRKNLEVSQSLLRNGKGLPATVLRAESELESVKAQLYEAENGLRNASHYFNFLLNKPQNSPIEVAADAEAAVAVVPDVLLRATASVAGREELQMLKTSEALNQRVLQMKQQAWVPKLNAFVDLGAQADNMKFNSQARYYLLGVSLDMPVFNGFRNRYESRQALLELKSAGLSLEQTSQQLQLAAATAQNNLSAAWQHYSSARQRLQAAQAYFKLMEKSYQEGISSQIEIIDARSQLTTAQLQLTLSTYRVLIALARYEREITTESVNH